MKRIDSVNARPDENGQGKAGFHDNADLSGQDATYVTPDWFNTVQEELCNLLELNGIVLNPTSKRQLYDLLTTQADLEALADAIETNFIRKSQIIDNLTTNDATKPVSAAQAKNLQDNKLDKDDVVDLLTSIDSKKALSANAGRSLFRMFLNSHGVNGYQKIANPIDPNKPLIIQWGVQSESIIGTFPIAFPNEAFIVVASAKIEYAPWDASVTSSWIISKTQFRVGCGQVNGSLLYWVALGN